MIDLHFCPTPNGQKISIALIEMGLPYRVVPYDIFAGDHLAPSFGAINPNHKLPAIVDHAPPFGGAPHAVFETGAILQYLADKTGQLLPEDRRARSVALQWLTWQFAGMGPMCGQAAHFNRYAPAGNEYSKARYNAEAVRLLTVLNNRLEDAEYLAGSEYSIADIAVWAWWFYVPKVLLGDVDVSGFSNIARWGDQIGARPAVMAGISGELGVPPKYAQASASLSDEEWSNMYGDKMRAAVRR